MGHGVKKDGERKKRSPNFTSQETEILIKEVEARKNCLFGELKGPHLTQAVRDRAWAAIAEKVNAVSPTIRTVHELKNKFSDMKTRTKQKANKLCREARKTGGGQNSAEKLTTSEQFLCSFIGKESIEGIKGGFDIGVSPSGSHSFIRNDPPIVSQVEQVVLVNPVQHTEWNIGVSPSVSHTFTRNDATTVPEVELVDPVQRVEGENINLEILAPPSPFKNSVALTTDNQEGLRNFEETTSDIPPKQRKTLKKKLIEVSVSTNDHLNNIYEELKTLNATLKRRLEIEEETLLLKKRKIELLLEKTR